MSWAVVDGAGSGLLHAVHDEAQAIACITHGLEHGVCFANAPADVTTLWHKWPHLLPLIIEAYEAGNVIDVLSSEKLIDIADGMLMRRGGYGLAAVALRRAGIELSKGEDTWRLRYEELLPYPLASWPPDARTYAVGDAEATARVRERQVAHRDAWAEACPGIDLLVDAPRRARAHLALYMQSLRGIRVDHSQVARVAASLDAEIRKHTEVCLANGLARWKKEKGVMRVAGCQTNAVAMIVAYCAQTGQQLRRLPPTEKALAKNPDAPGNVELSEEALEALILPPGHPLDSYRLRNAIQTMRTGWINPLTSPLGRIYTKYDELKDTGRSGSSGYEDDWRTDASRNLQNFPREGGYRECLIPDEGHSLICTDYSYAELVALAQVQLDWLGRSQLANVIASGRDPHGEFAATLLGIDPAAFTKGDPVHKARRQLAKAWNFGKPGAMGQARFINWARTAYQVIVTPEEERYYTNQWHRQWPEMRPFWDRVKKMEGPGGRTTIVQPRSGRVRGGLRFPEACNSQFQGLAADAALDSVWRIFVASLTPSSALFGFQPLLFVHDENVGQVRTERYAQAKAEHERIMIESFRRWCPDVPVKVETSPVRDRYCKE